MAADRLLLTLVVSAIFASTSIFNIARAEFSDFATCIASELNVVKDHSISSDGYRVLAAAATNPRTKSVIGSQLSKVQNTGSSTSVGSGMTEVSAIAAIVILPVPDDDWGRAQALHPSEALTQIVRHYLAQLTSLRNKSPEVAKQFSQIAVVYAAAVGRGQVDCALALIDAKQDRITYSSDKLTRRPVNRSGVRLEELPSRRSDVTSDTVMIRPGAGYLISPSDVLKSSLYLNSLDKAARATTVEAIKTDTTPWLVDEAHISWFEVDKEAAHRAALAMWEEQLNQANARLGNM